MTDRKFDESKSDTKAPHGKFQTKRSTSVVAQSDEKRVFAVGGLLREDGQFAHEQEIYLKRGVIEHILPAADTGERCGQIRKAYESAEKIDATSGVMLPGLINCHHHAYSLLARGMPVRGPLRPFRKTLENLWWRLDRCLDEDAVYLSGLLTGISCLRHGCTAIIDHHSSPNFVSGSLDTLAQAFGELSMTSVLCSEISDRNGPENFKETLKENSAFVERNQDSDQTRGLFGLHASFTLSSASLRAIAAVVPEGVPIHVHVAEDKEDATHAQLQNFKGPLHRLYKHDVLRKNSLIVHGIHLCDDELEMIDSSDLYLVHNPQSNFNNSVGYPNLDEVPAHRTLLGTDGMSSNMLGAAMFTYLAYLGSNQGAQNAAEIVQRMALENPAAYLSGLFGRPVGRIEVGYPADFAIFNYESPTPFAARNIMMHVLFGLADSPLASWVYARGNPVVEKGGLRQENVAITMDAARKKAAQIWERYLKQ